MEELALANGIEDDGHRIAQRQKQIDYGKNTIAYDSFSALLPREKRVRGHPMTPIAKQKCSKRSFAGQVTSWKKKVYDFVAKLDLAEDAEKPGKEKTDESAKDTSAETVEKDAGTCGERSVTAPATTIQAKEACDEGNEDEDVFSDMEDIQLDDQGHIVAPLIEKGSGKAVTTAADQEETYSDMDDIELDDMGNVITTDKTPPPSQGGDCTEKLQIENSPPSIFDVY